MPSNETLFSNQEEQLDLFDDPYAEDLEGYYSGPFGKRKELQDNYYNFIAPLFGIPHSRTT